MPHLNFEEISEFISLSSLTSEARELSERVITHTRECPECRAAVAKMLSALDAVREVRAAKKVAKAPEK